MYTSVKKQLRVFLLRWLLNSVGVWVVVRLLGTGLTGPNLVSTVAMVLLAGFIFSVVNSTLKPIITIMALPAILLTLGLFTLVVNGMTVYISLALAPGVSMSFGNSIIAGIILSLVNYIVSSLFQLRRDELVG